MVSGWCTDRLRPPWSHVFVEFERQATKAGVRPAEPLRPDHQAFHNSTLSLRGFLTPKLTPSGGQSLVITVHSRHDIRIQALNFKAGA